MQVGIIGGTGYTGRELIRILKQHGKVDGIHVYGRSPGKPLSQEIPELKGIFDASIEPLDPATIIKENDILFMALPHGVTMEWAPQFQNKLPVIDLSADYRLEKAASFEKWYGQEHKDAEALGSYVYALPEWQREALVDAKLMACPGCYPTAIILGALPLLEQGLVKNSIIADAKSGHSGAGKKLAAMLHAGQISGNIQPYKIGKHQHAGEMTQTFRALSQGENIGLTFTPQVTSFDRGILATLYIDLTESQTQEEVMALYHNRYNKEPFIRLYNEGLPPCVKNVVGTNFCDIGCYVDEEFNRVTIISCIDNLLKGASGQAVQAMNIALGFPETEGLYA